MKTYYIPMIAAVALSAALAAAAPAALAQTAPPPAATPDQIVVPLSHPSQPGTLKVSSLNGTITVRAYSGQNVVISSSGGGSADSRRRHRDDSDAEAPSEAQGMHKLNTNPGLTAEEDNNVVSVHTSVFGGSALSIQVPEHTSLVVHTVNGGFIDVEGITGDINVGDTNGNITLHNVSGSVVANALNGRIEATIAHLDPSKPSSFSSLNGTLDVTLPADVRCNLRLKTDRGDIYMDDGFNFQAGRAPAASDNQGSRDAQGMYKVQIDRTIYGTLNGGGPEIRMSNFNGNIYLRKGK